MKILKEKLIFTKNIYYTHYNDIELFFNFFIFVEVCFNISQ